jgi:uroporphyrinogen decarboxylase
MTSRERVIKTLAFDYPDQLPVDCWALPEVYIKHGQRLRTIVDSYSVDIHRVDWRDGEYPFDRYAAGTFTDAWGCGWKNHRAGIIGEVKSPPLAEWGALAGFKPPYHILGEGRENIENDIKQNRDKFILSQGTVNIFERMQHIRGTENLLMDIAEKSDEFYQLLGLVHDFYDKIVDMWLQYDVDAVMFMDDWGTQKSLLISPVSWREIFRPCYEKLIRKVKKSGRRVFFHSDGRIEAILGDLVELGCDAINSQVWIMDKQWLSDNFRGKVTFWGELDRQSVLVGGNPGEILRDIKIMKSLFMHQGGGLIGTASPSDNCSFEGIVESVAGWNKG